MKLNIIKNLFVLALIGTGLVSCSLNEYNPTGTTVLTVISSKAGFQLAINNCYFGLQRSYYGKLNMMLCTEGGTDLWTARQNSNYYSSQLKYGQGGLISLNVASDLWNSGWDGIGSCNLCIENVDKVTDFKDVNEKNALVAEAYFMRALYYYHLVEQFGDITLTMEIPKVIDNSPKRTSALDIYEKCIIPDLEFASKWLPLSNTAQEGRGFRKSAMGLLARAYLQTKEYTDDNKYVLKALDLAKTMISDCESGGTLYNTYMYPNLVDVFAKGNNLNNKESLYSVAFSQKGGSTNLWQHNDTYQMYYCKPDQFGAILYTGHQTEYGRFSNGTLMPSKYMIDLFKQNDNTIDPRFYAYFQTLWTANNKYTWNSDNIKMYDKTSAVTTATVVSAGDVAIRFIRPEESTYATYSAQKLTSPYLVVDYNDLYGSDKRVKMKYARLNDGTNADNPFFYYYPSLSKSNTDNFGYISASNGRFGCDASAIVMRMSEIYLIAAEADVYLNGGSGAAVYINKVRARAGAKMLSGNVTLDMVLEERAREVGGEHVRWYDLKRTHKLTKAYLLDKNPDVGDYFIDGYYGVRPIPQVFTDVILNGADYQNPGY